MDTLLTYTNTRDGHLSPIYVYMNTRTTPHGEETIVAVGKKSSTEACGCHREHLSCTNYCNCRGHDGCGNPHTTQGVMQDVDDDNAEIDGAGDEIVDRDEDVVVVADGEDEHADINNLDDEWEYIEDSSTVVIPDSVNIVFEGWSW